MYNEMSFLFSKELKVDTQRTNGIPLSNTKTLKGYSGDDKTYVVYKDKNFFNGQNGAIRNYIKEKIYDNDSTDTNPYIQLLKDPEFQSGSKTLRPSDFSYLRDLGVYPLNRLIILRRFAEDVIVTDDLNQIKVNPISVVIGWVKEDLDLFNLSFNEEWDVQNKFLHEIIADILKNEFKVGGAEKIIPSPGWTQGLLFGFLRKMGLTDSNAYDIPFGDPNLLREAAYRDYAKQGLKSSMSINFETVYEQKLIGEFDPATAMLDTIRNLLNMGTSKTRYIFSADSPIFQKLTTAVNNKGNSVAAWAEVVKEIVTAFIDATKETFEELFGSKPEDVNKQFQEKLEKGQTSEESKLAANENRMKVIEANDSKGWGDKDRAEYKKLEEENKSLRETIGQKKDKELTEANEKKNNETVGLAGAVSENSNMLSNMLDEKTTTGKFLKSIMASTFAKHRWPIRGSIGAMTGQPTTPWHITIGNPWSPIISAGNMIVDKIELSAKGELGFNDMPIFINANVSLRFGRHMGSQEIEKIFNNGYKRIYDKTSTDTKPIDNSKQKDPTIPPKTVI
jgi:hypothetical protein